MDKRVGTLLTFLEEQKDIVGIDINSDIEQDYGSFSLSGMRVESRGYIYPAALGFDLGCGVGVFLLKGFTPEKLEDLRFSKNSIFGIRRKKTDLEMCRGEKHMADFREIISNMYYGEIESGNHFLEIQKNDRNEFYLVVHSGLQKRVKEYFECLFIKYYNKYVEIDLYGDNGYVVKVPSQSEDGKEFFEVCVKANEWAKMNRNYIAMMIGKKIRCSIECLLDTSHEFLQACGDIMVHSNGVQMLMNRGDAKVGIIISGEGNDNYLICGKKGNNYINHGTKLRQQTGEGKRIYGDVEELMRNKDFSKKIAVIDVLTPILNCKKVGREYEYTVFRKKRSKID